MFAGNPEAIARRRFPDSSQFGSYRGMVRIQMPSANHFYGLLDIHPKRLNRQTYDHSSYENQDLLGLRQRDLAVRPA